MHDPTGMSRVHRVRDLQYDRRDFVVGQGRVALGVSLEQLTGRPFDREEMNAVRRLTGFDRPHYVGVLHSRPEGGFAQESGDGGLVLAKPLAQDLHGYFAVLGMLCSVDGRGTSLAHTIEEGITGQRCSDEGVTRHAGEANGRNRGWQANGNALASVK